MIATRPLAAVLLLAGLASGTAVDRSRQRPPVFLGGYRVLAGDFHLHSSMWSDGALTPWGLALEAERQGLDVIAITGHNEVFDAKLGRWMSQRLGGPTVLVGEEIHAADHHLIAVGIENVVDFRLRAAEQADLVHRQGGVIIAAHPTPPFWPGFDAAALGRLDGTEICHPLVYADPEGQAKLERFAAKGAEGAMGSMAAIGSSDYHGPGREGICRTYVFATENTAAAVVDALRQHRTVVYGAAGRAYGDPGLIALAATRPDLQAAATEDARATGLDWLSRIFGTLGLAGLCLRERRAARVARAGLTSSARRDRDI